MSKPCVTCKRNITAIRNPGISCVSCNLFYHITCVNLSSSTIEDISKNNLSWNCASCLKKNKRKSLIFPEISTQTSNLESNNSRISELEEAFKAFRLTTESRLAALEDKLNTKEAEVKNLYEQLKIFESHVNSLEYQILDNNLEVQGIPEPLISNPLTAAVEIGKAINCEVSGNDIECDILREATNPKLVLRFKSKGKRIEFLQQGKNFNREKKKFNGKKSL